MPRTSPPRPLSWDLKKANEHRRRRQRLAWLKRQIVALTPLYLHGRKLA